MVTKYMVRKRNRFGYLVHTALIDDRWQLKAQTFPKRGGSLNVYIVTIESSLDNFTLMRPVNTSY